MTLKAKERIKSIILVVLFLLTILLLYLVFVQNQGLDMRSLLPFKREDVGVTIVAEEVAIPQTVIYSNDQNDRIRCNKEALLYKQLLVYLEKFSSQGTTMVSEITKDQVNAATREYESLEFNFRYSIPFSEFCDQNEIQRKNGYSAIKNVTRIVLSNAAKDSVIIVDGNEGKYYRLISETSWDWADDFKSAVEFTGDSVYTAKEVLGVDNDTYIPVLIKRKTENLVFMYEQYADGTNSLRDITTYIFGDALGFVRKINDAFGNLTFMYGYGDKTVNIKADGTLEYKNSALNNGNSNGFYQDLQTAINFAVNCGGWRTESNRPIFKLAYAVKNGEDKNASYTFYFTQKIGSEEIVAAEGPAMKIVVENGQVSNYVRHAVRATESYENPEDVLQAANAIASVSTEVYKQYLDSIASSGAINESSAYTYTAQQIQRIITCFKPEGGALVPSWCIDFIDGGRTWIGLKQKQF